MTFDELVVHLRVALRAPLPGARAHGLMAPRARHRWSIESNPGQVRQAAGLLLIFPERTRPRLVLTVRSDTLGRHGGQVSLPGGVIEPGETRERAALREAQEEIGLVQDDVQIQGPLTPVDIAVSGFRLHPVLATTTSRPLLRPSGSEVSRILDVSIDDLLDPRHHTWHSVDRADGTFDYPAFAVDGVDIWGATAMVLAELLSIVVPARHESSDP